MDAMTRDEFCADPEKAFDRVCENHDPMVVPREGKEAVVVLSLSDFKSLEETAYLMRSPKNAKQLVKAIGRFA